MTQKFLPSPEILHKLLTYDAANGKLYWNQREEHFFESGKNSAFVRWNTRWAGKEAFFTIDTYGYMTGSIFGKRYAAHRVIMAMAFGTWPKEDVDHINGCRTDNRLANLRAVSRQENSRNASRSKKNTSGHTGVSWSEKDKRWRSGICINGKEMYLGNFQKVDDAIAARRKAERSHGFHENHGKVLSA
jgi:hypothetical protein